MAEETTVREDAGPGSAAAPRARSELDDPASLAPAVEAILLSLDKPIAAGRLASALELGGGAVAVDGAVARLNREYAESGRSFRVESVAGGYRLMTLPAYAPVVAAFHRARASTRLSRAAIETLAIVAYRQPITRAHLEAIRGVACGEVLRSLMERRLVTITGRAEELGRPMLYGTGKEFLDTFGLSSLKDLPSALELRTAP